MATPLYDALVHEYRSALRCVPGDLHPDRLTAITSASVSAGAGPSGSSAGGPAANAAATPAPAASDTTVLDAFDANGVKTDSRAMALAITAIGSALPTELGVVPYPRRANGVPRQASRHRGTSAEGPAQ